MEVARKRGCGVTEEKVYSETDAGTNTVTDVETDAETNAETADEVESTKEDVADNTNKEAGADTETADDGDCGQGYSKRGARW